METNTSKISVSELDFDLIKKELKEYFSSQSEFTEYNFEGSALNVLMDILSYNTHINAYTANVLGNEMFLDSASLRQSVISKSKEIGYVGRSIRAAKSINDISVVNVTGSPLYLTMDAGTQFQTQYDIIFSTKEDLLLYPSVDVATTYTIENVDLYEGNYVEFRYTVDFNDIDQKFIIPSVNADMSTLRVIVKPDYNSSQQDEFFINDDLNRLKPDTKVFFTHETAEGFYEVTFGDGILGESLINGNFITLSYIVSVEKESANNISKFLSYQGIAGYPGGSIQVTNIEPSYGGGEKESISDIKFLAPKMYQSQRRAVTIEDYETFLLHDYTWIDTINSWGGEYNNPPIYGKVFFAIKPKHTEFISTKLKEEVKEHLIKEYNVVTIVPEIVDPDYIYINIETDVFYIKSQTVLSETQLVNNTLDTIYEYFADTTEKFKMDYRFSPMVTKIDDTDQSFDSSLSTINIHKRVYPITNISQTFDIKFNNPIEKGSIFSSYYNVEDTSNTNYLFEVVVQDNSEGIMQLIHVSTNNVLVDNIGIVDYVTGDVSITIFPYTLPSDTLDVRVYATPTYKNIISGYNQIILPDDTAVNYDVNRMQGVIVRMNIVDTEKG